MLKKNEIEFVCVARMCVHCAYAVCTYYIINMFINALSRSEMNFLIALMNQQVQYASFNSISFEIDFAASISHAYCIHVLYCNSLLYFLCNYFRFW